MWSFTGSQLSWRVDRYLSAHVALDSEALLQTIAAYGALSAAASNARDTHDIPAEWNRLFAALGQNIMFDLPNRFRDLKVLDFETQSAKAYMVGWRGDSLPSPL